MTQNIKIKNYYWQVLAIDFKAVDRVIPERPDSHPGFNRLIFLGRMGAQKL